MMRSICPVLDMEDDLVAGTGPGRKGPLGGQAPGMPRRRAVFATSGAVDFSA